MPPTIRYLPKLFLHPSKPSTNNIHCGRHGILHNDRLLLSMLDLQFTTRSLLAVNVINEKQQHGGDI